MRTALFWIIKQRVVVFGTAAIVVRHDSKLKGRGVT